MFEDLPLLAVPNVSEGRDAAVLDSVGHAFTAAGARLLDRHMDIDHHRAVFTLAGSPGALGPALLAGAREAINAIDLKTPRGAHPHVGAVDVVPLVYPRPRQRGAACAEALVTAHLLATELGLPVFLYGILAAGRTRAELRRGGIEALTAAMTSGDLKPDFGPSVPHPTAGVVLVSARPPLIAFNVELASPVSIDRARYIAGVLREGGAEGIPGLRAIAVELKTRNKIQVSFNVEDPRPGILAEIVAAVARHHQPVAAEIVGLVPAGALENFPKSIPIDGFQPTQVLETAISHI